MAIQVTNFPTRTSTAKGAIILIRGKYVAKFTEATHALPEGMHMNADYPFKLPRITRVAAGKVTIADGPASATFRIVADPKRRGYECCYIEQSSSFEAMTKRPAKRFKCMPFRDELTSSDPADQSGTGRQIDFECSRCRCPIKAVLHGPGPGVGARIEFRSRTEEPQTITSCPNCERSFAGVTAEQFLLGIANWS
jgi:hypothetical protein